MKTTFMQEFAAALQLSRHKGVGAASFRHLLDVYRLPSLALAAWLADGNDKTPDLKRQSILKSATTLQIKDALDRVGSKEFFAWYYSQAGYPRQLHDLGEPPPVLFGSSEIRPLRFAAVVGARKLAPEAIQPAEEMVYQLVKEGYAIVSGGALGADTIAHKKALDLGAYTAAILATGLDIVYPAANAALFAEIASSGVLLSEMMPGAKPQRSFFPSRNRIIAALADVVAIVQADAGSGALTTAAWASRLGRRLLVLAPQTDDAVLWAGNAKLIAAGAGVYQPGGRAFSVSEPVRDFVHTDCQLFTGI